MADVPLIGIVNLQTQICTVPPESVKSPNEIISREERLLYGDNQSHLVEIGSDVTTEELPENVKKVTSNYGATIVVTLNGELYIKDDSDHFQKTELVPPSTFCAHGIPSSAKDSIIVCDTAVSETRIVVVDKHGGLWSFDRTNHLLDSKGRIQMRKLPLMGGMRKCIQLTAGRNHFLALVQRTALHKTLENLDDAQSLISEKLEDDDDLFTECPECRDDSRLRLSTLMSEADLEASRSSDLMKNLENDEDFVNVSLTAARDLRLRLDSADSSPMHASTSNSSRIRFRDLKGDSTKKSTIQEKASTFSFLSLDRIPLQTTDTPSSSNTSTPKKGKRHDDHPLDDEFVEVWSWGKNESGQLGHGDKITRSDPFPISFLTEHNVLKIAAGDGFSVVLTANGEVFTFGVPLQQNTVTMAITFPQQFKLGFDQFALDVSCCGRSAALLVTGKDKQPVVFLCSEEIGARVVNKMPLMDKESTTVSISLRPSHLIYESIRRSDSVSESFALWIDSIKLGRLLSNLGKLTQQLHENSRVTCAEDVGATVADLLHKLHLATVNAISSTARASSSLRNRLSVVHSYDCLQFISELQEDTFVEAYREYFGTLSDAIGFGCFFISDVSEQSDIIISRMCLEYGTESANLQSRLHKLFVRPVEFWGILKHTINEFVEIEVCSSRCAQLQEYSRKCQKIINGASLKIGYAKRTAAYWKKPLDEITAPLLRTPGRFLLNSTPIGDEILKISTNYKMSLVAPRYYAVMMFTDVLVLLEKKDYKFLPLELLWLFPSKDTTDKVTITLLAPEVELTMEFKNNVLRNKFVSNCEQWSSKSPAPRRRYGKHIYTPASSSQFSGSTYSGEWKDGMPDGSGTLTSENGTVYNGRFMNGEYHGFGTLTVPTYEQSKDEPSSISSFFYSSPFTKTERSTVYRGVFRSGKLTGLAHIRYWNGNVYEGYCSGSEPNGFGWYKWDRGSYLGAFRDGSANGYGVLTLRKEKHLGEWLNDKEHGRGSRVTIDGSYHEGTWKEGKITFGRLMCPPIGNSTFWMEYTGDFEDYGKLTGKGLAKITPTTTLEGQLTGDMLRGDVRVVDAIMKFSDDQSSAVKKFLHDDGPVESEFTVPTILKWREMFDVFLEEELGGPKPDVSVSWNRLVSGLHLASQLLDESDSRKSSFRSDIERIPPYNEPWSAGYYAMMCEYFESAVSLPAHPLFRLCHGIVDVYTASYNNMATHKSMYEQSAMELRSLLERTYRVIRILFPSLPDDPYDTVPSSSSTGGGTKEYADSSSDTESPHGSPQKSSDSNPIEVPIPCCEFLYSFVFPKVSPVVFSIYSLVTHDLDAEYWNRAVYLNAHTDVKLLTYLEVPRILWPIDVQNVGDLEKPMIRATARMKFYQSAIDTLQQLSTDANPARKLAILSDTFEEITACVSRFAEAGSSHLWGSDDLLPAFMYVVVRAQIQHLGCEIKMLDDFTKSYRGCGQIDLMFTMLKSSYVQIVNEKSLA